MGKEKGTLRFKKRHDRDTDEEKRSKRRRTGASDKSSRSSASSSKNYEFIFEDEDAYIPPPQARKPEPEYESIWWDDVDEGMSQDFWQAKWSDTSSYSNREDYDTWADRMRREMHQVRYGHEEQKAKEAEDRKRKKDDKAKRKSREAEATRLQDLSRIEKERERRELDEARKLYRAGWTRLRAAKVPHSLAASVLPLPVVKRKLIDESSSITLASGQICP
ncbi:hypothetical protein BC832DRAFT_592460 [Gaertneriomyces semiglobifer]|nr:hypothetical protein BC832DRAFT_592460 [Gaertneriomyces semiglobifer]